MRFTTCSLIRENYASIILNYAFKVMQIILLKTKLIINPLNLGKDYYRDNIKM